MTRAARRARGEIAYFAGQAAEGQVAQEYERRGYRLAQSRWRGRSGEIDLILRDGDGIVCVEVKKSRTFDHAAHRLNRRQMDRICRTAEEFIGTEPKGALTDVRFDVALLDAQGELQIIENAFGAA